MILNNIFRMYIIARYRIESEASEDKLRPMDRTHLTHQRVVNKHFWHTIH